VILLAPIQFRQFCAGNISEIAIERDDRGTVRLFLVVNGTKAYAPDSEMTIPEASSRNQTLSVSLRDHNWFEIKAGDDFREYADVLGIFNYYS